MSHESRSEVKTKTKQKQKQKTKKKERKTNLKGFRTITIAVMKHKHI